MVPGQQDEELSLRRVSLFFPHNASPALDDVSLTIVAGEFVVIAGQNGAGKTSLLNVIAGTIQPTSGTVWFGRDDVTRQPDYVRARMLCRVFDNPAAGTVSDMSVEENLALAMTRGRPRGLRQALGSSQRDAMRETLAPLGLGLERRLDAAVSSLSGGQRQSLALAMAAIAKPDIVLLDEHLAALDPVTQTRVLQLTLKTLATLGCKALMVTHNLKHASELGDRLLVLRAGRIVADIVAADKGKRSEDLLSLLSNAT